jgi:hypothetical protein
MHIFKVVKEPNGWAVRLDPVMCTPFRLRASAIREAQLLRDRLRRHGEAAEVVIDDESGDSSRGRRSPQTPGRRR